MKRIVAIALAQLLWTSAFAVQPDEVLKDAGLEARARALSAELRCLVCQNQSIDDSDAPLAKDLRVLIREQLTAGKSDAEVMDFVVGRYGDFVLLRPRFAADTLLLWLTPFAVLFGVIAVLATRRRAAVQTAERELSEREREELKKALD